MTTRRAADETVFHQNRYASAPEFERGLKAYLVAKRCTVIEDRRDRELVWFIQHLSNLDGGLSALADELRARFGERLQTVGMVEARLKPGMVCPAELVKKLRDDFAEPGKFILRCEADTAFYGICSADSLDYGEQYRGRLVEESKGHPKNYPSDNFFIACQAAAADLETELKELCLNPARKFSAGGPWYFPRLVESLREYQSAWVVANAPKIATTAIAQQVFDLLDYTTAMRVLTLVEGHARRGKTTAAKAWCSRHPGRARYVSVPGGNDQSSFFRDLARGLGLGSFLQLKATEIKERVEAVLLEGDLVLVLDQAHNCWPQYNSKFGFPQRIDWIMSMSDQGVPICLVATPQFLELQRQAGEKSQWNQAQLVGRISKYVPLPAELSREDLQAVARTLLPTADGETLKAMAVYAQSSDRYLAAIEAIDKGSRYNALQAGREHPTTADVRRAIKESVIPSDSRLVQALETGRKARRARSATTPPAPALTTRASDLAADPAADLDTRRAAPLSAPARSGLETDLPAPRRGNLAAPESIRKADLNAPLIAG